jgi:hypothetical protein
MKYLHSGYILFCEHAEHNTMGRINCQGLFDLFSGPSLPMRMNCTWVIAFGTPFERRQYMGLAILEDPDGREVFVHEFNANCPDDLYRGHYIFKPDINLTKEGLWSIRINLRNWKSDAIWEINRQFWVMLESDSPPDP